MQHDCSCQVSMKSGIIQELEVGASGQHGESAPGLAERVESIIATETIEFCDILNRCSV